MDPDARDRFPAFRAFCQLDETAHEELEARLREHSRRRAVHWLAGDPTADRDHPTSRHVAVRGGNARPTRLAEHESYGAWLRWLASDPGR